MPKPPLPLVLRYYVFFSLWFATGVCFVAEWIAAYVVQTQELLWTRTCTPKRFLPTTQQITIQFVCDGEEIDWRSNGMALLLLRHGNQTVECSLRRGSLTGGTTRECEINNETSTPGASGH